MRRGVLILLTVFALVLTSTLVAAQAVPGGVDVTSEVDRNSFPEPAADSVTVESGNITLIQVESNASTFRWAGLIGNVSGNIVLGDSNSYQMYSWTGEGRMIYASTAGAITWGSLRDEAEAAVIGNLTWLGLGADNYSATFTGGSENIGSDIFSALSSDFAPTLNSTGQSPWKTYSLSDDSAQIWAGRVIEAGDSYAGDVVDFQMVLPEDGTSADTASTTYNLWVELV